MQDDFLGHPDSNPTVSHNSGHLENLAKSQALYKHELDI